MSRTILNSLTQLPDGQRVMRERITCNHCGGPILFEEDFASIAIWQAERNHPEPIFCGRSCQRAFYDSEQQLLGTGYAIIQVLDTPEQFEE